MNKHILPSNADQKEQQWLQASGIRYLIRPDILACTTLKYEPAQKGNAHHEHV